MRCSGYSFVNRRSRVQVSKVARRKWIGFRLARETSAHPLSRSACVSGALEDAPAESRIPRRPQGTRCWRTSVATTRAGNQRRSEHDKRGDEAPPGPTSFALPWHLATIVDQLDLGVEAWMAREAGQPPGQLVPLWRPP